MLSRTRADDRDGNASHGDKYPEEVPSTETLIEHPSSEHEHQRRLQATDDGDVDDASEAYRAKEHHHVAGQKDSREPGQFEGFPTQGLTDRVRDGREHEGREPEAIESDYQSRCKGESREDSAKSPQECRECRSTQAQGRVV